MATKRPMRPPGFWKILRERAREIWRPLASPSGTTRGGGGVKYTLQFKRSGACMGGGVLFEPVKAYTHASHNKHSTT